MCGGILRKAPRGSCPIIFVNSFELWLSSLKSAKPCSHTTSWNVCNTWFLIGKAIWAACIKYNLLLYFSLLSSSSMPELASLTTWTSISHKCYKVPFCSQFNLHQRDKSWDVSNPHHMLQTWFTVHISWGTKAQLACDHYWLLSET